MIDIRRILVWLGRGFLAASLCVSPALLAAPACVDMHGGIGGTGNPIAKGGVDGTGSPVAKGGIGGTGGPVAAGGIGGTGIVGTITGFGSVCVNGLEVDFTPQTPISVNGRNATVGDLAVGQVISMMTEPASGGLLASSINVLNVLEGPVTQAPRGDLLQVMGQSVRMTPAVLAGINPVSLQSGALVQVSGYRDSHGDVYATRIQVAPQLIEASAIGFMQKSSAGGMQIGGTLLSSTGSVPAGQQGEVLVAGSWDGTGLSVSMSLADPVGRSIALSTQLVLEGLVQQKSGGNQLQVNGFSVHLGTLTSITGQGAVRENQLVRVSGQLGADRVLRADRIEIESMRIQSVDHQAGSQQKAGEIHGESDGRTSLDKADAVTEPPDLVDRIESSLKPERVERPEAVERIERIERPERPERVERAE